MISDEKKRPSVTLRRFEFSDIPDKVRWINDPQVNRYLHYDLPLEIEKTEQWFLANQDRTDRFDAVILADGQPVGLIGLLSIDYEKRDAEYYIALGEPEWFGKGIAAQATAQILEYAFSDLALNRVYLTTERENKSALRLYERVGFAYDGSMADSEPGKVFFQMESADFCADSPTPILRLTDEAENEIYMKRDDLLPFSFGGNKARKAAYFFREIDAGAYTCVVTYGSSSSNHCRVVANLAAARGLPCTIISPAESAAPTSNSAFMAMFGAKIITVPVSDVHDTIEHLLRSLTACGETPYFIPGGGHGVLGTTAYVDCYRQIRRYERANHLYFDDIFFASGTGTTQAGLICGQLLAKDRRNIVGISIARKNPRGRQVVIDSIRDYLTEKHVIFREEEIERSTVFCDDYTGDGYAKSDERIGRTIDEMLLKNGVPLDPAYTGKAYAGMLDYLRKNRIRNHRILFIHTGGTPLFFDYFHEKKSE